MRFMTLDPGHFHAALVQKSMYPQVSPIVDVFAPSGFDLDEHLKRIEGFNGRAESPTSWQTNVHTSARPYEEMIRDKPGSVVILAGRNSRKMSYILGSVENGLHVLADKPWIIDEEDLPRLERALSLAESHGVAAYDIMTERFEVTNELQRELVNEPAIFGSIVEGTLEDPAVHMRSVHHIVKEVAGKPLRRPTWFFDIREQGEALADIGTHLVDHTLWTLSPRDLLDYRSDVEVSGARRWPTVMTREQFARVTGADDFPSELRPWVEENELSFFANTSVDYTVRGVHVHLDVLWDLESREHGDTHYAVYRGDRARIEIRQTVEEDWQPEIYVIPNAPDAKVAVFGAVRSRVAELQDRWPGLATEERGDEIRIIIPERHRSGHEAHFGEVTERFLHYLQDPASLPVWEKSSMMAKYFITTRGSALSLLAES